MATFTVKWLCSVWILMRLHANTCIKYSGFAKQLGPLAGWCQRAMMWSRILFEGTRHLRGGEEKKKLFSCRFWHVCTSGINTTSDRVMQIRRSETKGDFHSRTALTGVCLCGDEQKVCWLDLEGALPWIFWAFAGLFSWRERSDLGAMVQLPLHLRQKSRNKKR